MNSFNIPYVLKSPELGSKMKVKIEKTKKKKTVLKYYDKEFHFLVNKTAYAGFRNLGLLSCNAKGN